MKRSILVLTAALAIGAALAPQAGAAAAPTATTGAASSVTSSSAVVSGTVNPSGQSTTYSFAYGTTTAYGSQTSAQSAGQDSTNHAVSATLTGLKAAKTYHYRVSATNASGTTVGADMTFTTAPPPSPPPRPPPPAATTGRVLRISQSGGTVTGTVNPTGAKTTYYFEFGVSPFYGLQTASRSLPAVSAPQAVSVTLHGLAPGQVYHYRLVARNANGTTRGADRSFSTAGPRRKRMLPAVTAKATPRRDRRRRFRFTIRGRVVPPKGVNSRQACRGQVTVRFKAGRKTILLRQVKLSRNCRYRARVRLKGRQRRHSSFRVTVHFLGNPMLKPRWARSQYVRIG